MHSEVAWVQVFSGTQVQPQIILEPDYLPDYISVSYDYGFKNRLLELLTSCKLNIFSSITESKTEAESEIYK